MSCRSSRVRKTSALPIYGQHRHCLNHEDDAEECREDNRDLSYKNISFKIGISKNERVIIPEFFTQEGGSHVLSRNSLSFILSNLTMPFSDPSLSIS